MRKKFLLTLLLSSFGFTVFLHLSCKQNAPAATAPNSLVTYWFTEGPKMTITWMPASTGTATPFPIGTSTCVPGPIPTAGPDSFEAGAGDNSYLTASNFPENSVQLHSIFPGGDDDWMTFTLTSTKAVIIETFDCNISDTYLYFYSSAANANLGVFSASDDDSGVSLFSRIVIPSLAPGTYFIRCTDFGDNDPIASYSVYLTTL